MKDTVLNVRISGKCWRGLFFREKCSDYHKVVTDTNTYSENIWPNCANTVRSACPLQPEVSFSHYKCSNKGHGNKELDVSTVLTAC